MSEIKPSDKGSVSLLSKEQIASLKSGELNKYVFNVHRTFKSRKILDRNILPWDDLFDLACVVIWSLFRWVKVNPPPDPKARGKRGGRPKKKLGEKSPSFSKEKDKSKSHPFDDNFIKEIRKSFKNETEDSVIKYIEECRKARHVPNFYDLQPKKNKLYKGPSNQRYGTPPELVEPARSLMGSIDLDPASEHVANKVVDATKYFTKEVDGTKQNWFGNVFMNPPFKDCKILKHNEDKSFIVKLLKELKTGRVKKAVIVIPTSVGGWFNELFVSKFFVGVCLIKGKVYFYDIDSGETEPHGCPIPISVVAFGNIAFRDFENEFKKFGPCLRLSGIGYYYDQFIYSNRKRDQALKKLKEINKGIETMLKKLPEQNLKIMQAIFKKINQDLKK